MHYVNAFFNLCLKLKYFSQKSVLEVKILQSLMQNIPDLLNSSNLESLKRIVH